MSGAGVVRMPVVDQATGEQLLDQRAMYQIIQDVLEEKLAKSQEAYPYDPEDLLELRGNSPRLSERQTVHELRLKDVQLTEYGYIGKVRTDYFAHTLRQLLDKCESELMIEQSNLGWEVVAVFVTRPSTRIAVGTPISAGGHIGDADFKLAEREKGKNGGIALNADMRYEMRQDAFVRIDLVYADVLGGELQDPNLVATGFANEMSRYAETRVIKDMPLGLRLAREKADRLIREFYDLPPRDKGQSWGPGRPVSAAKAAAEAQLAAVESLGAAGSPSVGEGSGGGTVARKPSVVALPEGDRVSGPAETARLLAAQGLPPAAISKRLKIPLSEVEAALEVGG